jgi:hypothetical protein
MREGRQPRAEEGSDPGIDLGLPEPGDEIRFYVRFALRTQLSATRDINPESTIDAGFRLLDEGWLRALCLSMLTRRRSHGRVRLMR